MTGAAGNWWREAASRRNRAAGRDEGGLWAELLRRRQQFGDTILRFHSSERPVVETSAGQLIDEAEKMAGAWSGLGLGQGDTLVIQLPHCVEGVIAFLAALRLGMVSVPVVPIYGPAELEFIIGQSKAKALIVPSRWRETDYADRLPGRDSLPSLEHLVVTGDLPVARACTRWDSLSAPAASVPPYASRADDVATMIYTSGTTASPKGVLHSSRSLIAETISVDRVVRVEPRPAMLAALPAGHMGGITAILRPFLLGTATDYLDHWNAELAAELVHIHKIEWTSLTPFHLSALLDLPDNGRLATLKSINLGATSIPPSLILRASEKGISCNRAYGSSEHPTISAAGPDDPFERRMNTDGRPMPGVSVRIVDEAGADVPLGVPGEILSRGEDLFLGYFDPALDAQFFTEDGWYRTSDVGIMGADGYLTIVDRLKDIIIRGGENISSKEVEDVLTRHPSVQAAAAIGWPDERYGERVAVCVEARPGATLTLEEVQTHFRSEGLARQKTPERLVLVDQLPRNASGKVVKTRLRDEINALAAREREA